VIRRGSEVLLIREEDREGGVAAHWFPPGGGIDFWETAEEALVREVREELETKIVDLRFLGVLEARWELGEERHHHLCLIYEGAFADPTMYERDGFVITEPTVTLVARWMPLDGFRGGGEPLHPQGLLDLLAS
jgi:ADP-ribose pyrophosphatase YjhB (NUDIX family)